jgi:N-acetylmuramoyl-L-alanine amidase
MKSLFPTLLLLVLPVALRAQAPLRISSGAAGVEILPVAAHGQPMFPLAALERLGADVGAHARGARAVLFGDTIACLALSPYCTVSADVFQLAFPARSVEGALALPEQFFIEWLPKRYPDRLEYRGGALRLKPAFAVAAPDGARPDSAVVPRAKPKRIVVLDAGHGGRDPGKTGPNGLREKDATLTLANRVASVLRERGYEVRLTRTRDTLIALADRPRMANRWKGDRPALFMSIHANSVASRTVKGFETFFLSEARTDDERRVAEMENAAIEFEEEGVANGEVDQILHDMLNDFYVRASSDLAETVQERLASFHTGPNRGVKRAGFRVLVGALMPAVLVEVAFISNREESRLLASSAFQRDVATALADAVDRFFDRSAHLWTSGS